MTDVIQWARQVDPGIAVNQLAWPSLSYMYLERVPASWLTKSEREHGIRLGKFDSDVNFTAWERGRIFCDSFELRWEKVDGGFHLVYAGSPAEMTGFQPTAENLAVTAAGGTRDTSYYLWGLRVKPTDLDVVGVTESEASAPFVESQVARVLYYPVSQSNQGQRIKLKVHEYIEPASGRLIYYRFRGLEEVAR